MLKSVLVGTAMAVAAIAVPANAGVITPVGVTASSTFSPNYNVNSLIDGSGLNADGLHDNFYGNNWYAGTPNGNTTGTPNWLVFDLGSVFKVGSADIWNYSYDSYAPSAYQTWQDANTINRGVKDFRILTSLNGVDYTEVFSGELALAATPGQVTGLVAAQNIAFAAIDARYVKLDILTNYHFDDIYNAEGAGLAEVRFNGEAVPEPATWAMMIGGFGLVGGALRRRRTTAVSFA